MAITEFEITAQYNRICKRGRVIRMRKKEITGGRNFIILWQQWTVLEVYEHHVLMRSEKGYKESFTKEEIKKLIREGEIK